MHLSIFCPPGGGGHTRDFRQKTIPDSREFDKLMESGSRVHRLWPVFTSRDLMDKAGSGWGFRLKWLSLGSGFRLLVRKKNMLLFDGFTVV